MAYKISINTILNNITTNIDRETFVRFMAAIKANSGEEMIALDVDDDVVIINFKHIVDITISKIEGDKK